MMSFDFPEMASYIDTEAASEIFKSPSIWVSFSLMQLSWTMSFAARASFSRFETRARIFRDSASMPSTRVVFSSVGTLAASIPAIGVYGESARAASGRSAFTSGGCSAGGGSGDGSWDHADAGTNKSENSPKIMATRRMAPGA